MYELWASLAKKLYEYICVSLLGFVALHRLGSSSKIEEEIFGIRRED